MMLLIMLAEANLLHMDYLAPGTNSAENVTIIMCARALIFCSHTYFGWMSVKSYFGDVTFFTEIWRGVF